MEKNNVYEVIKDFNDLTDFNIVNQKDRILTIYDIHTDDTFEVSVMDWLEKIYTYYTEELPEWSKVKFDFDSYDYEFSVYYYEKLLKILHAIEEEKNLRSD